MNKDQIMAVKKQIHNAKQVLTRQKIVEIANRKGKFTVDCQYRNDWIRTECLYLCYKGFLRKKSENMYGTIFVPVKKV